MTRILVVGAGATGGYFGARLAQAGRDVTFLLRPARAEALRTGGLRVRGLGDDEVIKVNAVTAAELRDAGSPYDVVLLGVKATGLASAISDVAPAVGKETAIVPFLNGMAHLDALTSRFGAGPVLGGVVMVATTLDPDGSVVRLASPGGRPGPAGRAWTASITTGELSGTAPGRLAAAEAALEDAGFDFGVSLDIAAAMWHKWVFIATIGALTCLMRGTVGDIVAIPDGARLGPAILAEAAAVSAATGYPVPADFLRSTAEIITQPGSEFASSMYRDVAAGLGTEAEQILGDLTARARTLGVAVPLLDLATLHLRVYEHRRD
jgi:2-dehydropantoate 2-reductase